MNQLARLALHTSLRRSSAAAALPRLNAPGVRGVCHFSSFTESTFHKHADETLYNIQTGLDDFDDEHPTLNVDSSMSSGVLNISLGKAGTWVINKQTPNKQIWYSSPISGPARYEFDEKTNRWVHTRDGSSIGEVFEKEVKDVTGERIEIEWDVEVS
jgi:frataxin